MQKQISLFTFLICALSLTYGQAVGPGQPVDFCLAGHPGAITGTVTGCSVPPCDVVQGTSAEMIIDFLAPDDGHNLEATVMATALGITGPYTLPDEHRIVCPNLELTSCPLSAGELARHVFYFPVGTQYPPIPVTVELTVTADNGVIMYCARVPIHVRLS